VSCTVVLVPIFSQAVIFLVYSCVDDRGGRIHNVSVTESDASAFTDSSSTVCSVSECFQQPATECMPAAVVRSSPEKSETVQLSAASSALESSTEGSISAPGDGSSSDEFQSHAVRSLPVAPEDDDEGE
jgi:hypothetical protein